MTSPLVPEGFAVPAGFRNELFVLEPLGVQHNVADHAAWTSSIEHIKATPGFAGHSWPVPMSLEENAADLVKHAQDFADRTGFTYTVLDPASGDVIGCVYLTRPAVAATTLTSAPGSAPITPGWTSPCMIWSANGWPTRGRSRSLTTPSVKASWRPVTRPEPPRGGHR